ncbi:MAG: hypothetical protein ABSG57_00660 [Candidatus Bathyarchaeia archaeon]
MPTYDLDGLGEKEFERMCQSLLKGIIGNGTTTFGEGPDGGREATFRGRAPYPSAYEQWDGNWIFQVKFHNTRLVTGKEARNKVLADLAHELNKIVIKYKRKCDNYILITNVPLSSVSERGTHDLIEQVISRFRGLRQGVYHVPSNIHVWGADEIYRFLEFYPEIRCSYLQFITPGDLIGQLMRGGTTAPNQLADVIRLYISTCLYREQYTQLDQAGEVGEERLLLQKVFIDLDVISSDFDSKNVLFSDIDQLVKGEILWSRKELMEKAKTLEPLWSIITVQKTRNFPIIWELPRIVSEPMRALSAMEIILSEKKKKIVLLGGPGQGKSTLGQYLAQIHRATLLGEQGRIQKDPKLTPLVVRVPFRVILREYAQWIMDLVDKEQDAFEFYLAHKITERTGREVTGQDVQTILKTNPCLLILDGLDEVTDRQLRTRILDRIKEFLSRSEQALKADIQVLGTSRPTGYSGYFDPTEFLHVHLANISRARAVEYTQRWVTAKLLEEEKAKMLEKTIEECLDDPRIQFLMNTPLQVTILILIILSGGTPPRQREALFDEYLEVIYKREKAKAKWIIQTEKQLLFGLHRYLGYIMQSRATGNQNIRAALNEKEFKNQVLLYLKSKDPFSAQSKLDPILEQIVSEARERLVLIVEMEPGFFGFELRSLQEFFAAGHLTDTAEDSTQRFERFEAIAPLPYWHNVALFFAGRVGRLYSGEAANIIEVCRNIDRHPPDCFLRRGARLGLELAADRSFGPNRNLQRTMIEFCMSILDDDFSIARYGTISAIQKLPAEDIIDHLQPVLKEKLLKAQPASLESVMDMYFLAAHINDELLDRLDSSLQSEDLQQAIWAVEKCLQFRAPPPWLSQRLPKIVPKLTPMAFAQIFARYCFDDPEYMKSCLLQSIISDQQIEALLHIVFSSFFRWSVTLGDGTRHPEGISIILGTRKEQMWTALSLLRSFALILNTVNSMMTSGQSSEPFQERYQNNPVIEKTLSRMNTKIATISSVINQQDVLLDLRVCLWVLTLTSLPDSYKLLPSFAEFFKQSNKDASWAADFILDWTRRISNVKPFLLTFLARLERCTSLQDTNDIIRWVTELSRAKPVEAARIMSKTHAGVLEGKNVLKILRTIEKQIVEAKNCSEAFALTKSLLYERWETDRQISQLLNKMIESIASIRVQDVQTQIHILIFLFMMLKRENRSVREKTQLILETIGRAEIELPVPQAGLDYLPLIEEIVNCDYTYGDSNTILGAVKIISALAKSQQDIFSVLASVHLTVGQVTMKRLIETNPKMRIAGIRMLRFSKLNTEDVDWIIREMEKCGSQEEALAWEYLIDSLPSGGDAVAAHRLIRVLVSTLKNQKMPVITRQPLLHYLEKVVAMQDSSVKIEETKLDLPLGK